MPEKPPIGTTVLVGTGATLYPAEVVAHGVNIPDEVWVRYGGAPVPVKVRLDLIVVDLTDE